LALDLVEKTTEIMLGPGHHNKQENVTTQEIFDRINEGPVI